MDHLSTEIDSTDMNLYQYLSAEIVGGHRIQIPQFTPLGRDVTFIQEKSQSVVVGCLPLAFKLLHDVQEVVVYLWLVAELHFHLI